MTDGAAAFLEPFSHPFMLRGLLIAVMLGISGGFLGCVLVFRRMALMGDALAHSLLPGMGIAFLLFGAGMWPLFAGALIAGLLTAIGSSLLTRLTRLKEDAAFGALFILFFGVGVGLLSAARSTIRLDLLHFLFGNVLAVSSADLWLAAGVSTLTLLVFALFYRHIVIESFDPDFYRAAGARVFVVHAGLLALIVLNLVAALQAMGVVLALGLFLLPAVSAALWCDRWGTMLLVSSTIAVAGGALGLLLSYHIGIPSGPCIVGTLGAVFLLSALSSPRHGFMRWTRRRH